MTREYVPDNWVVVELPEPNKGEYKVIGGWSGGYLDGDYWRVNSGIKDIEVFDDYYIVHGYSSSTYKLFKDREGLRMNLMLIFDKMIDEGALQEDMLTVFPEIQARNRNALRTPDGTVLESVHRHDYRTYKDKKTGKEYMIDGGLDYVRSSANGDEEYLTLYDDEPHEVQRKVLRWGTYGKEGDQPLIYKCIADMEEGHILAVLQECRPRGILRTCMEKELEWRSNN